MPLAAIPTTTSRSRGPRAARSRAPFAAESSAPSAAARSGFRAARDHRLHHLRARAECRRAFGRIEHREAPAGARADVDESAAVRGFHDRVDGARDLRQFSANRERHARIFAIQDAQNFERGFAVQASRAWIRRSVPAGFNRSASVRSINYSGRRRRDWRRTRESVQRCAEEVIERRRAAGAGPEASKTASCSAGRTWRIFSFSRVGFTRLVSRMTKSSRSGSIHSEVPVKPLWPKLCGEK